jgi:hypothetical protein
MPENEILPILELWTKGYGLLPPIVRRKRLLPRGGG